MRDAVLIFAVVFMVGPLFVIAASDRPEDWSKGLAIVTGLGFLILAYYLHSIVGLLEGLRP